MTTHLLLREIGGTRYLLCDTKGKNLSSTVSFHALQPHTRCLRCEQRWEALAKKADGDASKMRSFLNLEVEDKYQRKFYG